MPPIIWAPQAQDDLREIWRYIARDDVDAADRMIDQFEDRCLRLAEHPEAGRARPELAPGLRSLPVGRYIVFYRPGPDSLEIARVVHGARDLPALFGEP